MRFILVPFLLGIYLGNDYDTWKNGPEYTFDITVSTESSQMDVGKHTRSRVSSSLKCLPKEPDRLQCRFESNRITKLSPEALKLDAMSRPEDAQHREYGFGNFTFEMKFNEKGVEEYLYEEEDRPVRSHIMNMCKLVANHLSIWWKVRTVKKVDKLENTTVRECMPYKVSQKQGTAKATGFRLGWYPDEPIDPEEATEITRVVHLNDCIPHPVYRMPTRHRFGAVCRESNEKLRSSRGNLYISHNNFISESTNTVDLYDLNRDTIGSVCDRIRLSLVSVQPAQSGLKVMTNTTSVHSTLSGECYWINRVRYFR